jgi:hypothetical protein
MERELARSRERDAAFGRRDELSAEHLEFGGERGLEPARAGSEETIGGR